MPTGVRIVGTYDDHDLSRVCLAGLGLCCCADAPSPSSRYTGRLRSTDGSVDGDLSVRGVYTLCLSISCTGVVPVAVIVPVYMRQLTIAVLYIAAIGTTPRTITEDHSK